jgi:hypothetical protein
VLTDREHETCREVQRRLLIGPNLLTDDEVADRQQPPTPQVEWVPAGETQWLFGPSDSDPFRSLVAPVSTPSSGFAPSVAA